MTTNANDHKPAGRTLILRLRSLLLRVAFFAILWWVLSGGRMDDLWLAVLCIAAAVWATYWVRPWEGWKLRPIGLLIFVPFFLWHAIRGGIDVALRAFHPRLPLDPGFIEYPLSGSDAQSLVLAWTVSLLPGTASVQLEQGSLKVHVLDQGLPVREDLERLDRRIRKAWG